MPYIPKQKYQRACVGCSVSFVSHVPNKRFCTDECRIGYYERNYRAQNPGTRTNCGTTGAVSELMVAADLMRRGYEVFRAISPQCSCDLAILKNKQLVRVEVKTGRYNPTGSLSYPKATRKIDLHDVLAVVVNGQVKYIDWEPDPLTQS